MGDIANKAAQFLRTISLEDYFNEKMPSRYDDKINNFMQELSLSDFKVQELFRSKLDSGDTRKLCIFAERVASLAIRNNSVETVATALYALSFCYGKEDDRDMLVVICLLNNTLIRLKQSPRDVLNHMNIQDWNFRRFVEAFFDREEEDKTLKAFNFIALGENRDFVYRRV